jgi:hypothetical protein
MEQNPKIIKNFVNWLCCYATRGSLEDIAEDAGFKNPCKLSRTRLEDIAFVDEMCGDITRERYRIFDDTTGKIIVNDCSKKYMICYILKNCIYNWYEEPQYPVMRDSLQHKVRVESLRR